MNQQFKAILFDLDGTLLDTLADLSGAMNEALGALGFPGHTQEDYRYFIGDGIRELVVRVLPPGHRDAPMVAQCLDAMRSSYGRCWSHKTAPYANIPALFSALVKNNISMAVLSNKPHEITVAMINHFFPNVHFSEVRGHEEGIPRKPDPAAALAIAEKMGLRPDDFVYLGDTNTDMKTAIAAGMKPVGALWGFRTKDELVASGAEIVIEDPLDVLKIF